MTIIARGSSTSSSFILQFIPLATLGVYSMAHTPIADEISFLVNDVPDLTEDEKNTLISVMIKAKELDAQERNKINKPVEGQLYKYTNVVKGWQYRWFVLVPYSGILEYYMLDEVKKKRPRGAVYLAGAVISPSDEDGQSFTISAACGGIYKLKANDAKERQIWVNRIRAVAEHHTKTIAEKNPPLPPRDHRPPMTASSVAEALNSVRDMLIQTEKRHNNLVKCIEVLPSVGTSPKCNDKDLLLLKATAGATFRCLQQCFTILQYQQVIVNFPKAIIEKKDSDKLDTCSSDESNQKEEFSRKIPYYVADPSGEMTDEDDNFFQEIKTNQDYHEHILNLMSQMKLGSDLTKIALPSFALEPRSLLEMFADFMRHPDYFVRIPECLTAESRMLAVLEWYLTLFHAGRKSSDVRKPYNPIIGETFRCSWRVSKHENIGNIHSNCQGEDDHFKVTFVAEQVSHHPPVSAFYVECPEKNMAMGGHVCVKSNFLTSHIGVNFIGEVKLKLLDCGETYIFSFPSAYVRGVLTVPWIELGGRVSLTCDTSGYSAFVTFQTKPPQNGAAHKIIAEVKNCDDVICRVTGEWNGVIQFIHHDGTSKTVDINELPRHKKYIRPIDHQDVFESRRLWQEVTKNLKSENFTLASKNKEKLEAEQRLEENRRQESGSTYQGQLFQKIDDAWEYKYPLPVKETS